MDPRAHRGAFYDPQGAESATPIVVTGIDVPFGDLVMLLLKIAFAAIPAAIILSIISAVLFGIISAVIGGLGR